MRKNKKNQFNRYNSITIARAEKAGIFSGLAQYIQVQVWVDDEPNGRYLGSLNIPGSWNFYLNIIIRLFGLTIISGHFKIT